MPMPDRQAMIQFGRVHFGVFSTSGFAPPLGLDDGNNNDNGDGVGNSNSNSNGNLYG